MYNFQLYGYQLIRNEDDDVVEVIATEMEKERISLKH